MLLRKVLFSISLLLVCGTAFAMPSIVEEVISGVHVVRDDSGQWTGHMSLAVTHQNKADYEAKKILDASDVPADVWAQAREVRVSVFMAVRDYSAHSNPPANGLDEEFEIVVNGTVNTFPTNCGAPVFRENTVGSGLAWYDFILPKEQFVHGVNEIVLRKGPSDKNDDFLYIGIDNSIQRGNSMVTFDGSKWTQEMLTIPGGTGEYKVRMYLVARDMSFQSTWQPGRTPALDDSSELILFHGSQHGTETPTGLRLAPGQEARMEWRGQWVDPVVPVRMELAGEGRARIAWFDEKGERVNAVEQALPYSAGLPADREFQPTGLSLTALDGEVLLHQASVSGSSVIRPVQEPVNMRPDMAAPAGSPANRPVRCTIGENDIILENATLRCRFGTRDGRLQLRSLYNEWTQSEMVQRPGWVNLFLIEVEDTRYAGSRDFALDEIIPQDSGFVARLSLKEPALQAQLAVTMTDEGLQMGLDVVNSGQDDVHFKTAFPHLAGLKVSENAADDYYYFPWGGGIFNTVPARISRGYGDHEALYQVMNVFSPQRGGGLYIRCEDDEGWHKIISLRKYIEGAGEFDARRLNVRATPEYMWSNPFEAIEGTSFTFEYLRRTRAPGEGFSPASAVIAAHQGDWRVPMGVYADWARSAWTFRPYPSRLKHVHNMMAAGWGQSVLFRDGAYRTDIVRHDTDCIELMSWWDWSPLGPWSTPFDKLEEVLDEATIKMWQPYFVKDPVTGEMMWNNQPGDYDGYNERFGGLPAFRQAIDTYRDMGALVTLYTDPFRLDDASASGQKYGRQWGVVGPDGKHTTSYEVWNPCHDNPDVRQWVAEAMERVMRETGADGIRLDEYGHRGWVCYSDLHEHTYQEPGVSQWQKATSEATRMVREGMDRVNPDTVLTTEHPGYDYMLQYLEGCITYDLTVQATPLRPLEVNLQRFYFPECKAYELDHRQADLKDRKKFWNGVASFGRYLPPAFYNIYKENADVYASFDCEALIPTITPLVYANRFRDGNKTFIHLYNARGASYHGTVMEASVPGGYHLFDMLSGKPVELVSRNGKTLVSLFIERDNVACFAMLPQMLQALRNGQQVTVRVNPPAGAELAVCDINGTAITTMTAQSGANVIDLANLPDDKAPATVKLLLDGTLLDIAAIPAANQ